MFSPTCLICRRVYSIASPFCPYCGNQRQQQLQSNNSNKSRSGWWVLVGIFVALNIVGIILNEKERSTHNYQYRKPDYNSNAPLLPRYEGDIQPLYNEVERRKAERGISDREAVNEILREYEGSR
jgi:hypothetical protein